MAIPSAPVTSVNTLTGAVTLTTAEISEGANLYFTDARARTASVANSITDNILTIAPSQNAVFDALALKMNQSSFIDWSTSGVQTIDPSRLNLGAPSASKALVTNGSGLVAASAVTSTELGYLSGATSSIQTQLNTILSKTLSGLSVATNAVITAADTLLTGMGKLQAQITSLGPTKLDKTGGTLSVGTINGVPNPTNADDVANKAYADSYWSNGSNKMVKNSAAPTACDANSDASIAVTSKHTICICQNGTGWVSASDGTSACVWAEATLSVVATTGVQTAMNVTGVSEGVEALGSNVTFTLTNTGGVTSNAINFALTNTTNFAFNGGTCASGSTTLAASASCTIIVRPKATINGAISGNLNITAHNNPSVSLSGTASGFTFDPCPGSPTPGTVCPGGAIFLGTLSPGATSGSGTNKYMTTPGGCGEIPAGQIVGSGASAYPNADFTPTCSGTDSLTKTWNDGTFNAYDIPELTNYTAATAGTEYGASNTDQYYGSDNTTIIAAIMAAAEGSYHAAARYCDKLNFGGYTDWYLPNRYELNLMFTNKANIPGLDITGSFYWSSTEYDTYSVWVQRFDDGYQSYYGKAGAHTTRCIRRY